MNSLTFDPTLVLQVVELVQRVPYVGPLAVYLPAVCFVACLIDAHVPQASAGSPWVWPRRVVSWLAFAYGYARNTVPAGTIPASVAAKATEAQVAAFTAVAKAGELADEVRGMAAQATGDPRSK